MDTSASQSPDQPVPEVPEDQYPEKVLFYTFKISGPFFMMINTYRKADRTIIMFCKIRKASAGVHHIAIITQVISQLPAIDDPVWLWQDNKFCRLYISQNAAIPASMG
ncbi:MAG: hypothetical protein U0T81_03840 [Saprospiraceae bacterium]